MRSSFRAASWQRTQQCEERFAQLAVWGEQRLPNLPFQMPDVGTQDGVVHVLDGGSTIEYVRWVCPASKMCKTGFAGGKQAHQIKKCLEAEWTATHQHMSKTRTSPL
jgi:hypothetical protein